MSYAPSPAKAGSLDGSTLIQQHVAATVKRLGPPTPEQIATVRAIVAGVRK